MAETGTSPRLPCSRGVRDRRLALIQVVTQVFPLFRLPDWIDQAVVLLVMIGFPIALVLAWAFDATPQAVVPTDTVPDAANANQNAMPPRRSQRDGVVVVLSGRLIALMAGGEYWHFGQRPAAQ